MDWIYSSLATGFMFISITIYLFRLFRGHTTTSPITWAVALISISLSNATFYFVVHGNLKEIVPAFLVNLGVLVIFIHSLIHGKWEKPSNIDLGILVSAFLIVAFWCKCHNAEISNALAQVINLIGFVPTIRGLIQRELRDHPLPWLLAVTGFGFQLLTILSNPNDYSWYALIAPIANGIIGNGTVGITAWRMNLKRAYRTAIA